MEAARCSPIKSQPHVREASGHLRDQRWTLLETSISRSATVRQRREIGITAIRYSDCHLRSSLRMASHLPHGGKKMPRMLILVRWDLFSCRVGWSSQMGSLASATCSMPTPSGVLAARRNRPISATHMAGLLHSMHRCLFLVPMAYVRSRLDLERR